MPDIVPDGLLKLFWAPNFSGCSTGTQVLITSPNFSARGAKFWRPVTPKYNFETGLNLLGNTGLASTVQAVEQSIRIKLPPNPNNADLLHLLLL